MSEVVISTTQSPIESMSGHIAEIKKLSVSERIQIVEEIWDSIAQDSESIPLSHAQQQELDRRIADAEARPGAGRTWAEIRSRLLGP